LHLALLPHTHTPTGGGVIRLGTEGQERAVYLMHPIHKEVTLLSKINKVKKGDFVTFTIPVPLRKEVVDS